MTEEVFHRPFGAGGNDGIKGVGREIANDCADSVSGSEVSLEAIGHATTVGGEVRSGRGRPDHEKGNSKPVGWTGPRPVASLA
jgi:hypothetical protein